MQSVPGTEVRPSGHPNAGTPTSELATATAWPKPGAATLTLPAWSRRGAEEDAAVAGSLPVRVATLPGEPAGVVRVDVRRRAEAAESGVSGVLLRLESTGSGDLGRIRLTVDYSAYRGVFGGDWASRVTLVAVDQDGTAVSGVRNDTRGQTLTADIDLTGEGRSSVALTAATSGPTGDYKATSLAPSGSWQADLNSGNFAWRQPLRVPPVPGGLAPDLGLSYSSQSVDGRVVAQNNQPSWVGEGWDFWPGYIERSYKGCADDLGGNNGQTKTGDLCWETENATALAGPSQGPLVKVSDGVWRPESDDGTRVAHVTGATNGDRDGEYWVLTTTDGTKYYFGLNRLPGWAQDRPTTNSAWTVPVYGNDAGEPCHEATFDASACAQAYRWNLDYVVDVHGNSMSYFYTQETNKYGQNLGKTTTPYTRNGVLAEIHYGTRTGNDFVDVPAKVVFDPSDRCVTGKDCALHNATSWPDVPWDLECTEAPCKASQYSPSFWSTKRLGKITTQILTSDGSYRSVDQWRLTHTWPSPGDGTDAGLWLNSIQHTGLAKTTPVEMPEVTFTGAMYANRVNSELDGLPKMNKPRLIAIDTASGSRVGISYEVPNCSPNAKPVPETNKLRCFPVRWAMPPVSEPSDDWFHKYVVSQVSEADMLTSAASKVTKYEYVGDAAWAWNDNPLVEQSKRSWSDWRGYEKVTVRVGDGDQDPGVPRMKTQVQFFRGMNGDRLNRSGGSKSRGIEDSTGAKTPDNKEYAGFQRETITYLGDTSQQVSGTISTPEARNTATQAVLDTTLKAFQVENVRDVTRTSLAAGGFRTARVDRTYDGYGNLIVMNDAGDLSVSGDEECTTTTYAQNTAAHLVNLSRHVVTEGVACHDGAPAVSNIVGESRTFYDGHDLGAAPSRGLPTRVETVASYTGSTPKYVVATATFDAYGRPLTSTDALSRTTKSSYTETRGLTTTTTSTNPLGHAVTNSIDPAWGVPTKTVDANDRITTQGYDALGRLLSVYLPGRTTADGAPNVRFGYGVRKSGGANWVSTAKLTPNGTTVTAYELFDGLLRSRQTQTPSPVAGGRILTNTTYDSRGLAVRVDQPYYNSAAPGTTFFRPDAGSVPGSTVTVFDGAGRATDTLQLGKNAEMWRSTTEYGGDSVTVAPPRGGTVTKTAFDVRGRTSSLVQRGTNGEPDVTTRYTYTKRGDLESVTDAANNVWRYEYDLLGQAVTAHDPDAGTSRMTYDDAGQLLTTTDGRGKTVANVYDKLGRVIETHLGAASGDLLTENAYDGIPGGKGMLTSATRWDNGHPYKTVTESLDAAGRPLATSVTIPEVSGEEELAGTYRTTYSYKPDGSLSSKTLPALGDLGQEPLSVTYTPLGQTNQLKGAATYIDATAYTELGETSSVVLGPKPAAGQPSKQVTRWMSYDEATRRLTGQALTRIVDGSTTAHAMTYEHDPAGNVTKVVDHAAGSVADTQCYDYDYLRRVTQVWTQVSGCAETPSSAVVGGPAPYWQTFDYDKTGNRTRKVEKGLGGAADEPTTYRYPQPGASADQPHSLTSATTGGATATYTYDESGNTTTRPGPAGVTQTLTWDDAGQLSSIASGASTTSYVYDATGAQLIRRDPGKTTLYVGEGEIVLNTTTGAETGRRYYEGVGTRTKADGLTYLAADRNGTAQVAMRATDPASVEVRRMDLFGNPRAGSTTWHGGPLGFVNGTSDPSTNLTRLGAREYDVDLGRFVSVDPIIDPSDPQQMNPYAYSNNSPVTFTDPDGLRTWESDDGRSTDSRVVGSPAAPAKKPPTSHANTQDFGGRCPAGAAQSCAAASNKKAAVDRARQHDFGAKPDPNAYDPDWYWDWNEGVFTLAGACAPETGQFHGTSRCSDTQVALAVKQLKGYDEQPTGVKGWVSEHSEEVAHVATSFLVGVGVTATTAALCGTVVLCGLGVGIGLGAVAGVGAHYSVARLMGEEVTPAKLWLWGLESIGGSGVHGLQGVAGLGFTKTLPAIAQGRFGTLLSSASSVLTSTFRLPGRFLPWLIKIK